MSAQIKVEMSRHFTERRHSTWTARVPVEMLSDPTYFNASGIPTSSFDQWMCDNGVHELQATTWVSWRSRFWSKTAFGHNPQPMLEGARR